MKFVVNTPEKKAYDNTSAHAETRRIMEKGERLSIRLSEDKNRIPYAWIESKTVEGYKEELNQEILDWLMQYLNYGSADDIAVNPQKIEPNTEEEDFQVSILRQLIELEVTVKSVSLFREQPQYVSATALFRYGKLFFRMKRTEELVDYLREKGLV